VKDLWRSEESEMEPSESRKGDADAVWIFVASSIKAMPDLPVSCSVNRRI
jgi:hypothetical protein